MEKREIKRFKERANKLLWDEMAVKKMLIFFVFEWSQFQYNAHGIAYHAFHALTCAFNGMQAFNLNSGLY